MSRYANLTDMFHSPRPQKFFSNVMNILTAPSGPATTTCNLVTTVQLLNPQTDAGTAAADDP